MVTRESPRRTRLLASGLLVLTFVVGVLAGAATDRMLSAGQPNTRQEQRHENERRGPRRARSIFLDTLVYGRIDATPAQRQAIEAILARRDQELDAQLEKTRHVVDSIMSVYRHETRAQLSSEQLTKLDQIIQEKIAARQKERAARDSAQKSKSDSAKRP
jgi:succinate dehydrogenase/fumarate reductase flavoprotein subunit